MAAVSITGSGHNGEITLKKAQRTTSHHIRMDKHE